MKNPFIVGEKVYLRGLLKSDLTGKYLQWLNDREVTKYMETGFFPTNEEKLEEFYNRITKSPNDVILAIIDKKKNVHIGNVKLGDINWIHRYANLGIMIGEKDYCGKGYGTEVAHLVLDYAFKWLNLHKVILGVVGDHKGAMKSYEKAGFKVEGRIKSLLHIDGKYCDKVIMGIEKEEFLKKWQ